MSKAPEKIIRAAIREYIIEASRLSRDRQGFGTGSPDMAVKASHIRITPLYGGRSETGVCTLLEMGGARILLDCGATLLSANPDETTYIRRLAKDLKSAGGVDAILLSHADLHHAGALPVICGANGLQDVPIICTVPASKFAHLALYDYLGNLQLEGENVALPYSYDDIDHAFARVITLKYSQLINLPETREKRQQLISVCAIPSGRTLGGAIWRIRCGPAEVLYAMDANLRKEVMLDGASLDLLPTAPTLLITEAACASRAAAFGRKKKDRDEMAQLLSQVLATLRSGGNALIPCECTARIQELLMAFSKYWTDNKLGMYHLIFLSQMSRNVVECSRMQLEWMSDSLTRPFYNGKPNPLDLAPVKCITDARTIDRKLHGPKVVFATDASLSHGVSKDLLLKWGGDPRCKVFFTETSEPSSLAAQLRALAVNPPVIATVHRPVKEELVGQELANYRIEQERRRKAEEEERQRKRRQAELSQFTATAKQQGIQDEGDQAEQVTGTRKKSKTSALWQVLEPNLLQFERKAELVTMDEFGLSLNDLQFQDILPAETRLITSKDRTAASATGASATADGRGGATGPATASGGPSSSTTSIAAAAGPASTASSVAKSDRREALSHHEREVVPYKVKSVAQRVHFTCEFVDAPVSAGRMDLKAFKALIAKTTPARLFVVRGSDKDCETLLEYAKLNSIDAYAPRNRRSATLSVHTERLRMQLSHALLPKQCARLQKGLAVSTSALSGAGPSASSTGGTAAGECTLYVLRGRVSSLAADVSGQEGTRLIKYQGEDLSKSGVATRAGQVLEEKKAAGMDGEEEEEEERLGRDAALTESSAGAKEALVVPEEAQGSIGVVSLGEVTLNQLKQQLESQGLKVEFMIGAQGGALICNDQVIVRKENNDLFIEGPPVKAFYDARKIVYQQFAFL